MERWVLTRGELEAILRLHGLEVRLYGVDGDAEFMGIMVEGPRPEGLKVLDGE